MKLISQQGYILTECLVGLIILSIVGITLVSSLPILLQLQQQLEIEQAIYYKLYELKDQSLFYQTTYDFPLQFMNPISYTVIQKDAQLCATYKRGDSTDKTICF